MDKTTKILETIGVVFLFVIVFGAIAGAMGDAGRTPGILGLILFGILICVLRAIWTKSKNEEDNLNPIDTKQKVELQPVKKPIDGKYESLYAELTSKCYPQNFMEPYDHQKVKIANEIYAEILKSAENLTKLKELRIRAIKELNIQFSTEELYKKLLDLTNPQKFMEFMREYDAEKVSLANDFYQRVKDNANDVIELEAIQDEINRSSLIPDRLKEHKKIDDTTNEKKGLIISLLCIGFVVIIIIAFHAEKTLSTKDKNTFQQANVETKGQNFSLKTGKSYATNYYTIKYPKHWQVQEHIDEMAEVYIGYQPENFGFTIVRFETDYSLPEVNAEGKKNIRQAGFKILEEKQMKVDGVKCYKTIQEIAIQGQKVKHISYTFKKGDMLYNIKFGSVTTKTQESLASDIIDSFHFK